MKAADIRDLVQMTSAGLPIVQIWTHNDCPEIAAWLAGHDVEFTHYAHLRMFEAPLAFDLVEAAARQTRVLAVTPVYRPITRAGTVQSQGDAVLTADLVRALGYDGSGIKVGVISDSALNIANSQATGDLPADVDGYLHLPASDEGRAMLEIVHDIAPGASLAHSSGFFSDASFATEIRRLAASGSRVIVDDLAYFNEPFFQDGIIAQAVDEVAAAGVVYVSAAGNDADRSYVADFDPAGALHDFDPGAGVDSLQQITVPAGLRPVLILQWDDPFYTTAGVTHDFDVRVYNATGTLVASGTTNNLATQQPLEVVPWTSSGNGIYQIEITRVAGSGASKLKYVLSTNADGGTIDEFATHSGTVFGHAAAAGAIAVGAVPYYSPNSIEAFSARGDSVTLFGPTGDRLASPIVRQKPDVVAPDNVNTTFFGKDIFQDVDTFPNFAGTSAAAPHVAAVTALVLDANPHLTRSEVVNVLTSTAIDLGAPGPDSTYGFGRVDAEAAVAASLAVVDMTAPTAVLASPVSVAGWDVTGLVVRFSEPMSATVQSPANYSFVGAGVDQSFGTGDDIAYSLVVATAADRQSATLTFASPTITLGEGLYRAILSGPLVDPSGNPINAGANQTLAFSITGKSDITTIDGASQIDLRPDGTLVAAAAFNPMLGYRWPQVLIGQADVGGVSAGPMRSTPTNIHDSYAVENVDVAVNAAGGIVVYSDHEEKFFGEPDGYAIDYQRIGDDGLATGPRTLATLISANADRNPRVALNGAGAFVIAYPSLDYNTTIGRYESFAKARRYDAAGTLQGDVLVPSAQAGAVNPVVALAEDGSLILAWERSGRIYARRYNDSGAAVGNEFSIGASVAAGDLQTKPEIALRPDGSFLIAWQQSSGLYAQRLTSTGVAIGSPIQVFLTGAEPRIAVADDGRFVVVWRDADGDGDGVFAQRFSADGSFLGPRLWVNGMASGAQSTPRVAMRSDGDFVVSWNEPGGAGRLRWYAWNAADDALPFGPMVRSLGPASSAGSLSSVTVQFDRAIDAATFVLADAAIADPAGREIAPASIAQFDVQTFTIGFAAQTLPGEYLVKLGPDIRDPLGNVMNQDGDAVNGETGDAFLGSVNIPSVAASFPVYEGFEAASIDALPHAWSFAADKGTVAVTSSGSPHSGAGHLQLTSAAPNGTATREAVLTIDLSSQSSATNLALDFWLSKTGYDFTQLLVSDDGSTFTSVASLDLAPLGQYVHYSFDLDAVLSATGVALDADVYVKFLHQAYYATDSIALDDIRVSSVDVFGPRVVAQSPTGLIDGPLSTASITFDEPMDAASFTAGDVTVTGPSGSAIALAGDPVDSGDGRTFVVTFASPQDLAGTYTIAVGPNVLDLAGNPMNQDGDAITGETNGNDRYSGTIQVGTPSGAPLPYVQNFEAGSLNALATNWSFAATAGTVDVVGTDQPHDGSGHLRFANGTPNVNTQREAVLKLDLAAVAGQTNLSLDFWLKKIQSSTVHNSNLLRLFVSGNGTSYSQVGGDFSPSATNQYLHLAYDLDAILVAAGVALDADVYFKFLHDSFYANEYMTLDDVRVGAFDVTGPRVVSQSPASPLPGPLTTIDIVFSEPIDPATLTTDDVQLVGPDGKPLALAGDPVAASTTAFALTLAAPAAQMGTYRLTIGPAVADLAGNSMNQNQDVLVGAPDDTFTSTTKLGPAPAQPIPYVQDFENATLSGLAGWSFATTSGTVEVVASDSPHGGVGHLRFANGSPNITTQQEAVLKLDLSAVVGQTNLSLDFWLKKIQSSPTNSSNLLRLFVSGDGTTYSQVGTDFSPSTTNQYLHLTYDLDAILASAGVALDADVSIKFVHSSFYANEYITLDDVRVGVFDSSGPRIVGQSPSGTTASSVSSIAVTFNEPIDAASLTAADVVLTNPAGNVVTLAGDPVDSGDHLTFTLTPAQTQTLVGAYALKIGPDVRDLAGNRMNQNQDNVNADPYSSTFAVNLPIAGVTLPYTQDFDGGTIVLPGWVYSQTGGEMTVDNVNAPYQGNGHLRFRQTVQNTTMIREAALKLDLSAFVGATNLVFDAWLRGTGSSGTSQRLYVSGDGANFVQVGASFAPPTAYTSFVHDLDQILATAGVVIDGDVYVKFQHSSSNSSAELAVDQIRVFAGTLNNAPTLTSMSNLTGGVEDQSQTITFAQLATAANEADVDGTPLSFRVAAVTTGTMTKDGVPIVAETTLISAGESLVWTPAANANGTLNAFTVRAWDGDLASLTVQVKVVTAAVNDAPVLDGSGTSTFTAIAINATTPVGDLVSAILGSALIDVDASASKGIAVVGLTETANGTWQYSTNGGSSWSNFGTPSESAARLLTDTAKIRFVPNAGFADLVSLTFRGWDRTSGSSGSTTNLTGAGATGGATAYSAATRTASLHVVGAPTVTSLAPVIGPTTGGTLISIVGTNFMSITAVKVGGASLTPSSYTVVSSSQITATMPAHIAGAVDVEVVNAAGTGSLAGTSDFTYATPAVASVEVNSSLHSVTLTSTGSVVSLAGQNSVVNHVVVTFNQAVTVASDAFTVTPRASNVTVHGGAMPSTLALTTSVTPLSSSEYLLTFSGPGTHNGVLNSGIFDLATLAGKVTANGDAMAANRIDTFFAMFGTIDGNNSYTAGTIGNGGSHAFVDPGSLFEFSDAFGSSAATPSGPPAYNVVFDANLDGFIDPGDLFAFSDSFGIDWVF